MSSGHRSSVNPTLSARQRQALVWLSRLGPCSQTELRQRLVTSATTVWQVVQALVEKGWVAQEGTAPSHGGRPATRWTLAPMNRPLGVIRLYSGQAELRWFDLAGTSWPPGSEPAAAATTKLSGGPSLLEDLRALLEQAHWRDLSPTPVGWSISVPGLVSPDGVILYSSPLGLENVPVGAAVAAATGLPVQLGNDVDLAAIGEARGPKGRGYRRLVYLWVDQGIGMGLVEDGRLYLGSHGSAGELGHFTVSPDGPLCRCGNHGCLGVFASGPALISQATRLSWSDPRSALRQLTAGDLNRVDLPILAQALAAGDQAVRQVIAEAFSRLGVVVANLINLLGPDVVLVAGSVYQMDPDRLLNALRQAVATRGLPCYRECVRIEGAQLGPAASWGGAVAWFREWWWEKGVARGADGPRSRISGRQSAPMNRSR